MDQQQNTLCEDIASFASEAGQFVMVSIGVMQEQRHQLVEEANVCLTENCGCWQW
jgi:hypothetical protein